MYIYIYTVYTVDELPIPMPVEMTDFQEAMLADQRVKQNKDQQK